jgi:hypothetical protein
MAIDPGSCYDPIPPASGPPVVNVDNPDGTVKCSFFAYDPAFAGEVPSVAANR